jgi:Flp pilus assembly protein TadG
VIRSAPAIRIPALGRAARSALSDQRGVATVEFAVSFTLFFMLLFGIVELGRVLWTVNGLHLAAQQAARYIAIHQTTGVGRCGSADQTAMQNFAAGYGGTGIPGTQYTLTCAACGSGNVSPLDYQVTASYSLDLYIPFVAMKPTLNATACFPIVN